MNSKICLLSQRSETFGLLGQLACFTTGYYIEMAHLLHYHPVNMNSLEGENGFLQKMGHSWGVYEWIRKIPTGKTTIILVPSLLLIQFLALVAQKGRFDHFLGLRGQKWDAHFWMLTQKEHRDEAARYTQETLLLNYYGCF